MNIKKTLSPAALAVLTLLTGMAFGANAQELRRSYIVQLADQPVASYSGGISGLNATKPAQGQRLDIGASAVQAYLGYLDGKQTQVLNSVAAANLSHKYSVVFNGFAALLTDSEVRLLKKNSGVANIAADAIHQPYTNFTPTFLGLDKPVVGLWNQLGGQAHAGEDIIIGMIDSGIWPESPSFADRVDDVTGVPTHSLVGSHQVFGPPPAKWRGECIVAEGITAANCNNKLIGARYFLASNAQVLNSLEFRSARDAVTGGSGGHGSHTTSTAGGNANGPATSGGVSLGAVSGMAPRARIAAYKVCWGGQGCASSSTVAAVEAAVRDGVDVLNYSIGPTAGGGSFVDPTELAFLGASNAGVFLAAAAGNAGPATNPASNLGPWHATVGNSTHNRLFVATATLGDNTKLTGASYNANTPSATLILAKDAGFSTADASNLRRCFGGADSLAALLDPAKVAGKVLVCDRGGNVLVNKSANANTAGAVGVILANTNALPGQPASANTILNQPHTLSTIHLTADDGDVVKAYIAAVTAATSALGNIHAVVNPAVLAPVMANSSSRGPNVANANILKPDMAAPGSDILATVSPNLSQAERDAIAAGGSTTSQAWALYTGTSMASPHVAGLAALLKQQHPTWSPAMIKSALMTTAFDTFSDGLNGAVAWDSSARTTGKLPWAQGAGQVDPNKAADPGLVYDAGELDYARFLCGINAGVYSPTTCQAVGQIASQNLNLPSLTAASVLGSQTLTRTVTNVSNASSTYTATASLAGYSVEVLPPSFTIAAGAKQTFTVKLTRGTAPLDTWAYGSLNWSDGVRNVRSPLTARGAALVAASSVYSEAVSGSKILTIGTGFAGALTSVKGGLKAATKSALTVGIAAAGTVDTTTQIRAACLANSNAGVRRFDVLVPANTLVARFATYDAETSSGSGNDLDILVLDGSNTTVGGSLNAGSNEMVTLTSPAAGTYKVCVAGYATDNAISQVDFTLSSWVVTTSDTGGNFKVLMPGTAYLGGTASVGMSWSGLAAGQRHLGAYTYVIGGVTQGRTMVEVNTNDPVPSAVNSRPVSARAD